MNIAGSGVIPAGDYQEVISISGSGKLTGTVRCEAFSASGAASGKGDLYCREAVKVSGSMRLEGSVEAASVRVSGSFRCGGSCTAKEEIRAAGAIHFDGAVKCAYLRCSGTARLGAGAEAEEICIERSVQSDGLLNAEYVDLRLHGGVSRVTSIGGSDIHVKNVGQKMSLRRLFQWDRSEGSLEVSEAIEGEVVLLENTSAPLVVGEDVTIGAGCDIELVQYKDKLEVHPKAKVGRVEKL